MKKLAFLLLVTAFTPMAAFAHELSGPAKIIDGDTIVVQGTVVRLLGIDAAETRQRDDYDFSVVRLGLNFSF